MKRLLLILTMLIVGVPLYAATEFTLENGIPVVYQHIPQVKVVSVQIWMKTGSVNEPAPINGISHFLEHMVFKGTASFGPDQIDELVEAKGGSMNAATSKDYTNYYVTLPTYNAPVAFHVISEMVFDAKFIPEEIEKEKPVVVQEIKRKYDSPTYDMWQYVTSTLFKGTPYEQEVIGTEDTVNSFNHDKLMDYYTKYYHPENMTLVVVGDITLEETKKLAQQYFNKKKAGHAGEKFAGTPFAPLKENINHVIEKDVVQEYGIIAFRAPELLDDAKYSYEVLSEIVAGGEFSLLNRVLKHEKQLVSSINAGYLGHKHGGAFLLIYTAEKGKGEEIRSETLKLLDGLVNGSITEQDIEKAKNRLKSQTVFQREKVSSEANDIGYSFTLGIKDYYFEFLERVGKIDAASVKKRAAETFSSPHIFVQTVPTAKQTAQ